MLGLQFLKSHCNHISDTRRIISKVWYCKFRSIINNHGRSLHEGWRRSRQQHCRYWVSYSTSVMLHLRTLDLKDSWKFGRPPFISKLDDAGNLAKIFYNQLFTFLVWPTIKIYFQKKLSRIHLLSSEKDTKERKIRKFERDELNQGFSLLSQQFLSQLKKR